MSALFFIDTLYSNTNNSSFSLCVNTTYKNANIVKLSALENTVDLISSARVVLDKTDNKKYLEIYYNQNARNRVVVSALTNFDITLLDFEDTNSNIQVLNTLNL